MPPASGSACGAPPERRLEAARESRLTSVDGDALRHCRLALRQGELEHAVDIARLRARLIDRVFEDEAPGDFAVEALASERALAFARFLLVFHFRRDRDFTAVDGDVDVFLA